MASLTLSADDRAAVDALAADLRRIFGERLYSLVLYGLHHRTGSEHAPLHTLALVDGLRFDDLTACVPLAHTWHRKGLAVPLLLSRQEFERSLDVFPLEYGDIIAHHVVIAGQPPFEAAAVPETDLRRACEQHAKSHLIHLREGFIETGGRPEAVARLIADSARAFRVLLSNIARLEGLPDGDPDASGFGVPAGLVREILSAAETRSTIAEPTALLARYIAAVEQLWKAVDTWRGRD